MLFGTSYTKFKKTCECTSSDCTCRIYRSSEDVTELVVVMRSPVIDPLPPIRDPGFDPAVQHHPRSPRQSFRKGR